MVTDQQALHSRTALVSGREAAAILGVGWPRWRQLVSQVGPGITTPGVRGARWPVRDLIHFAAAAGRKLAVPFPPWVPAHERSHCRYRPSHLAPAVVESTGSWSRPLPTAHVQLHEALTYSAGVEHPSAIIVTPIRPGPGYLTAADVQGIVKAALARPGWLETIAVNAFSDNEVVLAVAIMPVLREHPSKVYDEVTCFGLTKKQLAAVIGHTAPHMGQFITDRDDFRVDAADVAACLGWSSVPVWPHGCATAATVSAWRDGSPVAAIPDQQAELREALAWCLERSERAILDSDTGKAADLREVARVLGPSLDWPYSTPKLPSGMTLAATVVPAPGTGLEVQDGGDMYRGLAWALGTDEAPARLMDAIRLYFGDPLYARPTQTALADLPEPWPGLVRDAVERAPVSVQGGARILAMGDLRGAREVRAIGPACAPVFITGDAMLVWLPPTGFRPDDPFFMPADALDPGDSRDSASPVEILVVNGDPPGPARSQDERRWSKRLVGWARWADGRIAPLPGPPPGLGGGETKVWQAMILGVPDREVLGRFSSEDRIADALATAADRPLPVRWSQLASF